MAQKLRTDRWLFFTVTALILIGVVMVYSSSAAMASEKFGSEYRFFSRQVVYALMSFLILFGAMNMDYRIFLRPTVVILGMIVAFSGLLAVFIYGGSHGARRWIYLPFISLQPSEFAKVMLIIAVACYLHYRGERINEFKRVLLPIALVIALCIGLILAEPDFGTAVCLTVVCAMLLFCARLHWGYFAAGVGATIPLMYFAIFHVQYRHARWEAFLDPFKDPHGAGYQAYQSLLAVGKGGILGVGLGESKQKLFFLPEPHSDFIFAVIGEEVGLLGATVVLMLFAVLLWRGAKAAAHAPDSLGFYLGMGLTTMLVLQALINVSVVVSLMPTKGITLPFVSAGGSSLLMSSLAAGILLNISQHGT
jgi:cell division protein FtsW